MELGYVQAETDHDSAGTEEPVPSSVPEHQVALASLDAWSPMQVGSATEDAEREADRSATDALSRLRRSSPGAAGRPDADPPGGHARRAGEQPAPVGSAIGLAGGVLPPESGAAIERLRPSGRPLEEPVRRRMEAAFGASFAGVRVHDGPAASGLNRSMSSRAFTTGQDIFFRSGEYAPETAAGEQVLAHELAHTRQPDQALRRRSDHASRSGAPVIRRGTCFSAPAGVDVDDEPLDQTIGGDVQSAAAVGEHLHAGWDGKYRIAPGGHFDGYSGHVQRLLTWLGAGGEGTAGIAGVERKADVFDGTARAAEQSIAQLAPLLRNDENSTFVVVRTFQAPEYATAARQAADDLSTVAAAVSGEEVKERLVEAGLVGDEDALARVEASPSEMHPNTLPTVRLHFGEKVLFFKGRSKNVEEGLVGNAVGAVLALGPGASAVGTHRFVGLDVGEGAHDNAHLAEGVGRADPGAEPGAEPPAPVAAWTSAVKTALAVLMSATSDMHPSNFVDGSSGKRHIIDGEFLLNPAMLDRIASYRDAGGALPFDLATTVPDRLRTSTSQMEPEARTALADAVHEECEQLWNDEAGALESFRDALREVVEADVPLRTFLGATDQWLGLLPAIHQRHDTPGEVRAFLGGTVYPAQREDYEKYFEFRNNEAAVEELERTMIAGGVPVFHIRSASRTLLMNKAVEIGEVKEGYGATEVLTVATAFVTDHKDAILAAVREEILRD